MKTLSVVDLSVSILSSRAVVEVKILFFVILFHLYFQKGKSGERERKLLRNIISFLDSPPPLHIVNIVGPG